MMAKRIERTTSRTAEWTCVTRAASYLEKNPHYRSNDHIALELVPRGFKVMLKVAAFRRLFTRKVAPAGIYEYVIARTRYIDDAYRRALKDDFDQILIFGAGFDSRALRFLPDSKYTHVFELDSARTQQAKQEQYDKRGLDIPSNLTFIPINFEKESLVDKLRDNGFDKKAHSLFVLEGLLMYLDSASVHETFKLIKKFSCPQSRVVFDYVYASVLRQENTCYGEKAIYKSVSGADEKWQFGIEEDDIKSFLKKYDLTLLDHKNAHDLEKLYFTDSRDSLVGRVNGTHCLVTAESC